MFFNLFIYLFILFDLYNLKFNNILFILLFIYIAQCVIDKNCNNDVSCIARCYNVPAPTVDMVHQTNDCAIKCPDPAVDNAGYLKCYNDCVDNFYMGNNNGAAPAPAANNANANNNVASNTNTANDANANNAANNAADASTTNNANNANNANTTNNANNASATPINNANAVNNTNVTTANTVESSASSMTISAVAIATALVALLF